MIRRLATYRLRFSLRSLLLATTVLGLPVAWLGQQAQIVAERKAVRKVLTEREHHTSRCGVGVYGLPQPNWWRRLLGDAYEEYPIWISSCSAEERSRFERAFPELKIITDTDVQERVDRLTALARERKSAQQADR